MNLPEVKYDPRFEKYWNETASTLVALKLLLVTGVAVDDFKTLCYNLYLKGFNDSIKDTLKQLKGI
jgi:hypothetical protein